MKICFCGLFMPDEEYFDEFGRDCLPNSPSVLKLNRNLVKGFGKHKDVELSVIASYGVRTYPKCNRIRFPKDKFLTLPEAKEYRQIGFINLTGIKLICRTIGTFIEMMKWVKRNKNSNDKLVAFTNTQDITFLVAVSLTKFFHPQIKTCIYNGDLHTFKGEFAANNMAGSGVGKIRLAFGHLAAGIGDKLSRKFDSFGFVTKYMAGVIGVENKPLSVVEGIYEKPETMPTPYENSISSVFYSGTLYSIYDIPLLLEAFTGIEGDYELWFAGVGDAVETIKEYAKKDSRIKYFGLITPSEVTKYQQQSTILINTRQNKGIYTKYSFPSKTLEYLASGKPVIAYKLDGIPDEYDEFLRYPRDNSVEALRDKLSEVFEMPKGQRDELGKRGQRFILDNKNAEVQCGKIVEMLKGV